MAPVFFISYACTDIDHPRFRRAFKYFVDDLKARVANQLPQEPLIASVDADLQTGTVWRSDLSDAIAQCKVGVALYSPRYFTRSWCGKEFEVLRQRSLPGPGGSGIIPVQWEKVSGNIPECAASLQHTEGQFPTAYAALGMRQLVTMRSVKLKAYEETMQLLAKRIAAAAEAQRLGPLPPGFDLDSIPSAWELAIAADPNSHKEGSISKMCFVFLSKTGSDWIPYQDRAEKIGTLAEKITGELGVVGYEEIPCDDQLPQKLVDTNKKDVPTVLFGDPKSLGVECVTRSLEEYDARFLPNCAALIAWEPEKKDGIDADARWAWLKKLSKVKSPPPFHEWRSVFSHDDLDRKTRTVIEQIRSQLLKQLVSDPERASSVAKAENMALAQSAAAQGIDTQTLSRLGAPNR